MKAVPRWNSAPLLVALLVALSGCAWTRRENRPVWTAFEDHLVPASQPGFAIALPVTVPLGLLAIVVDTLIAHPLQVLDDAWDDALDPWRGIDFEKAYYTQAGVVPLRAAVTPAWFALSFLGRSMFDIRSHEQGERERAEALTLRQRATVAWLREIAAGGHESPSRSPPPSFDAELRALLATALAQGTAAGRMQVYEQGARSFADAVDWNAALTDPSAVVRFHVLERLPSEIVVPESVWSTLEQDADEAVRALAARLRAR